MTWEDPDDKVGAMILSIGAFICLIGGTCLVVVMLLSPFPVWVWGIVLAIPLSPIWLFIGVMWPCELHDYIERKRGGTNFWIKKVKRK